ncbi:MAG: 23S rRNA pseudouridine(1911/1915/1917) synthase RluD [Betaproteobacteria bacterium]|nr:23S rRNA pseudouridine(1911/1915/1917) synthase RluD [Betaproteobacteria bacterium]MDH3436999.1 23S rRNA pseudouridine(1911/1915/1917) synthase RluD [Betaproteobacteria bacterium]
MKVSENYSSKHTGMAPLRLTVPPACAGLRLDQALSRLLPQYSRSRLARWVRASQIRLDGAAALPRRRVWGGEVIDIVPAPDPVSLVNEPEDIALDIVHEDAALLVINKPAGLVVHPGSGNWSGTLLNALLRHLPDLARLPRAGIVHRLDKDTSGLLVVAKTFATQTDLVRQLQARSVTREYRALVHGRITRDGKVEAPIGRHPVSRTRMAVVARGRHAVTHYEVMERFSEATLLRCRLETGRTHQIRVHFASIGHPLVGDPTYGKRHATLAFPRQALHAERLALRHPETRRVKSWRVSPPADMQRLIRALRKQA